MIKVSDKMLYFTIVLLIFVNVSQVRSEIPASPPCELRDAYGYDNIANAYDDHDWVLVNGPSSPGTSTGPSNNRANDDSCYLLHKATNAKPSGFSLLVFSCYTAMNPPNSQAMLQFYHYTYGRDVGFLEVYLRHRCLQPDSWNETTVKNLTNDSDKIWSVLGSQDNSWTRVELDFDISSPSSAFQVIFKALERNGNTSVIALDEINISGIECYLDSSLLCDKSSCILQEWVCDDYPDCIDETDEPEPGCCNPFTKFKCVVSGRCIDIKERCDGVAGNCGADDNSDETNCTEIPAIGTDISTTYHSERLTSIPDSAQATEGLTDTPIFDTRTGYTSSNPNKIGTGLIIGITVGCILVTSFAWVIGIYIWKRLHSSTVKRRPSKRLLIGKVQQNTNVKESGIIGISLKSCHHTSMDVRIKDEVYANRYDHDPENVMSTKLENCVRKQTTPEGKAPFYDSVPRDNVHEESAIGLNSKDTIYANQNDHDSSTGSKNMMSENHENIVSAPNNLVEDKIYDNGYEESSMIYTNPDDDDSTSGLKSMVSENHENIVSAPSNLVEEKVYDNVCEESTIGLGNSDTIYTIPDDRDSSSGLKSMVSENYENSFPASSDSEGKVEFDDNVYEESTIGLGSNDIIYSNPDDHDSSSGPKSMVSENYENNVPAPTDSACSEGKVEFDDNVYEVYTASTQDSSTDQKHMVSCPQNNPEESPLYDSVPVS